MLYKRLIWLIRKHPYTPALIYFKKIFHFLTFQIPKLPKTVAKKTKNMTSFPCSVRSADFLPYVCRRKKILLAGNVQRVKENIQKIRKYFWVEMFNVFKRKYLWVEMFNVFERKYFLGKMFNVFKSECAESPLESTRCFCRNQLSALLLNSFGPKKPWSLSLSLSLYICSFVYLLYTCSCLSLFFHIPFLAISLACVNLFSSS